MFAGSIPNFFTAVSLVERATKCFAMCFSSVASFRNQERAEWALVKVSWVVKVFEATRKRVEEGLQIRRTSTSWVESILETKCIFRSRREKGLRASVTMTGPRSDPPMPMLTTSEMGWPV